jgi:hypothetical protein
MATFGWGMTRSLSFEALMGRQLDPMGQPMGQINDSLVQNPAYYLRQIIENAFSIGKAFSIIRQSE